MDEQPRVYCGNCKWHRVYGGDLIPLDRSCGLHEVRLRTYWGTRMVRTLNSQCSDHNKNCDCQDYQRKWWKLWA